MILAHIILVYCKESTVTFRVSSRNKETLKTCESDVAIALASIEHKRKTSHMRRKNNWFITQVITFT